MKKSILPSLAITLSLFIIPILLTLYFITTRFSEHFIVSGNVNYFDVQNNVLGQIFLQQSWISWFNRAGDFLFWGVLASVVCVGAWAISASRTSIENHYAEESFTHFRVSKQSWHAHFLIQIIIKVLLCLIAFIAGIVLIAQAIPLLASAIVQVIHTPSDLMYYLDTVKAFFYIVGLQYFVVLALKMFRAVQPE